MTIRLDLKARFDGLGEGEVRIADPLATTPVAHFERGAVKAEKYILHDLFHHAGMGLSYEGPDEYLTTVLDTLYPWLDPTADAELIAAEKAIADAAADTFDIPRPTEAEVRLVVNRAKRQYGDLKPWTWIPRIEAALTALLMIRPAILYEWLPLSLYADPKHNWVNARWRSGELLNKANTEAWKAYLKRGAREQS